MAQHLAGEPHAGGQIDLDEAVQPSVVGVAEVLAAAHRAGGVQQPVEPTELVDGMGNDRFGGAGVGQVGAVRSIWPEPVAAVSASASSSRPTARTRAPSAAQRTAIARPMPEEPPVTTMVRSVRAATMPYSRGHG